MIDFLHSLKPVSKSLLQSNSWLKRIWMCLKFSSLHINLFLCLFQLFSVWTIIVWFISVFLTKVSFFCDKVFSFLKSKWKTFIFCDMFCKTHLCYFSTEFCHFYYMKICDKFSWEVFIINTILYKNL